MSRANIAPAEVKTVASQIRSDAKKMQEIAAGLNARLGQLGGAWQDAGFKKFEDEVKKTIATLKQFESSAEQHAQFLIKKADAAEAYLKV